MKEVFCRLHRVNASRIAYRAVVYINLHEDEVGMLETQLLKYRSHHLAWATPSSCEVCNYLRNMVVRVK